ncbi:MAG: VOC family protein [Reichenbachiella sp.]|uniref:VOC family protein n=1 Tax=Reichenbachiella sp. TaxID=2184521 RepID=UPI003263B7C4
MKTIILSGMIMLGITFSILAQEAVNLGDLKINQLLESRSEIQTFYKETLGAKVVSFDEPVVRDYIQFDNDLRLNLIYQQDFKDVPDADAFYGGLWIKILVDDFDRRYNRVKNSTAKIIKDRPEKGELYFQAPGGQVYRMVKIEAN